MRNWAGVVAVTRAATPDAYIDRVLHIDIEVIDAVVSDFNVKRAFSEISMDVKALPGIREGVARKRVIALIVGPAGAVDADRARRAVSRGDAVALGFGGLKKRTD